MTVMTLLSLRTVGDEQESLVDADRSVSAGTPARERSRT